MFKERKPLLLIVDDDPSILRVFSKIFQRKGFLVSEAKNGAEAVKKLHANRYDVTLVDFGLPDIEGSELFPVIDKLCPNTIKIMLTGKTYLEGTVKGADVFVGKPVSPEKLLGIIDTKLKQRDMESEH